MLAVEDALDGLRWAERIGGLEALIGRSAANLAAIERWVARVPWVDFLARDRRTRSSTSICLSIVDPAIAARPAAEQAAFVKRLARLLEDEGAAFDIAGYRDAPPGLRIWGGATVETADIECLTVWLDWAFAECRAGLA
jgi:phosphoserine aminotransferase